MLGRSDPAVCSMFGRSDPAILQSLRRGGDADGDGVEELVEIFFDGPGGNGTELGMYGHDFSKTDFRPPANRMGVSEA